MRRTEPLVHFGESAWEKTVARHRKPHARLPELIDQQGRDHAHQRADGHPLLQPVQADIAQRCGYRRGIPFEDLKRLNACQNDGNADIERSAYKKRGQDSERKIALRILAFLCRRRHRIESDVAEENDGTAGQHALPAVRHERVPVHRLDVSRREHNEKKDGHKLNGDHDAVRAGGFTNPQNKQDRQQHDNQQPDQVEMKSPASCG